MIKKLSRISLIAFFLIIQFLDLSQASRSQRQSADGQQCEDLYTFPIHSIPIMTSEKINSKLAFYVNQNDLTVEKAKGELGEEMARNVIDNLQLSPKLISIWTLSKVMKYDIKPYMHNTSGHGIDDIFIPINDNGAFIPNNKPNNKPIFHEAKYSDDGRLKLAGTKNSCTQLSSNWIKRHFEGMRERIEERIKERIKGKIKDHLNPYTLARTLVREKENDYFYQIVNWLEKKFDLDQYLRTASVLCPNGEISFYRIHGSITLNLADYKFFDRLLETLMDYNYLPSTLTENLNQEDECSTTSEENAEGLSDDTEGESDDTEGESDSETTTEQVSKASDVYTYNRWRQLNSTNPTYFSLSNPAPRISQNSLPLSSDYNRRSRRGDQQVPTIQSHTSNLLRKKLFAQFLINNNVPQYVVYRSLYEYEWEGFINRFPKYYQEWIKDY